MKFSEKLAKLRKENNKSQEQLADKLGVSRQAVSKWESGISVPDMEKMMQLCKILNCNLEDLIDDGVGSSSKDNSNLEQKFNWRVYYKEVLDYITKTLNMFWSMRLIEKVKCILEMLFLGIIIFVIWLIVREIVYSCFGSILYLIPNNISYFLSTICETIYEVFGIIIGFILITHIFKVRYLDYFVTIEDDNTTSKEIEIPVEEEEIKKTQKRQFIEKKKNKIIIRDAKHSTYNFFDFLAKLVIYFIKFMLIIFALPCIISFVFMIFGMGISVWYMKDGIFFSGIFITIMGALFVNYAVIKVIYDFIFDLRQNFRKIFVISIVGLILFGIGGSVAFCTYLSFEKISSNNDDFVISHHELDFKDTMVLHFLKDDNINIVVDDSINNIIVDIKHYKDFDSYIYEDENEYYMLCDDEYCDMNNRYEFYYYDFNYNKDDIDMINKMLDLVKNKKRFGDDDYYNSSITITASRDVLSKLENNYKIVFNDED